MHQDQWTKAQGGATHRVTPGSDTFSIPGNPHVHVRIFEVFRANQRLVRSSNSAKPFTARDGAGRQIGGNGDRSSVPPVPIQFFEATTGVPNIVRCVFKPCILDACCTLRSPSTAGATWSPTPWHQSSCAAPLRS